MVDKDIEMDKTLRDDATLGKGNATHRVKVQVHAVDMGQVVESVTQLEWEYGLSSDHGGHNLTLV